MGLTACTSGEPRFTPDGHLDETPSGSYGLLGDTLTVNGAVPDHHDLPARRACLRLLNGSSGRLLDIGLSEDREFTLIATDGGLLPAPVTRTRLLLNPGERAEILVDLDPGHTATLRANPVTTRTGIDRPERFGFDDTFDILTLRATTIAPVAPALPGALAALTPAPTNWRCGSPAPPTPPTRSCTTATCSTTKTRA
ncbi:hypothetical protein ACFV4K_08595 [Nocardia sp. NPDC059764]|uniref:hypothetical protein n=1 Tax=Nocardia sp. NPDC059764 TaxID=3346939 RepID=UPI00364FC263